MHALPLLLHTLHVVTDADVQSQAQGETSQSGSNSSGADIPLLALPS